MASPSSYADVMAHLTPAGRAEHLDVVKGSRFLAVVEPLGRAEDAPLLQQAMRQAHPDATHVCWAARWGDLQRWSDDGEPGGTAGRPMLEVALKRDLDRLSLVVVRYYGGVKLGAGGLARAYAGAAARALDAAGSRWVPDLLNFELGADFKDADALLRALGQRGDVRVEAPAYDQHGLLLRGVVEAEQATELQELVRELSRGQARWRTQAVEEG